MFERYDAPYPQNNFPRSEELLEAMVAACRGGAGAADAALEILLDLYPALRTEMGRMDLLAQSRPADYWVHG